MNGIGCFRRPASCGGMQGPPPCGQSANNGQLRGIPVRSAQGPEETPFGGLPIGERAAQPGARPAAAPPTSVRVDGSAAFRRAVARDLATFAPGTTVDDNGFVRAAQKQVAGHAQGYQLINDLLNNRNGVTISYARGDAFTQSGPGAQVAFGRPGRGSAATVGYDPNLNIRLPTLQRNGTIRDEAAPSSVVLAHELVHAAHAQRGTIDRSTVNHDFTEGRQRFRESWRYEEFRTVGFPGSRVGNEPTENSIRAELGFNPRAAYLDRSSWVRLR